MKGTNAMVVYETHRSRPLSDFHDELRFDFPIVMPEMLSHYLLKTAIQMATDGNLIRRRVTIQTEPGVTRYALDAPDDCTLVGIMSIREKTGCGERIVSRAFTNPADSCGKSRAWYDDEEHVLHTSSGCGCGEYRVEMSVAPKRDACSLPEEFYTDYLDTLLAGTRSHLMLIPGRPWTNVRLGDAYGGAFTEAVARLAVERMTHKQRGTVKMQFGRAL